jgi:hypothetical protein
VIRTASTGRAGGKKDGDFSLRVAGFGEHLAGVFAQARSVGLVFPGAA